MNRDDDGIFSLTMDENRDVRVEQKKTKLKHKEHEGAVPLPGCLLRAIDRLLQKDTVDSSSNGACRNAVFTSTGDTDGW